MMSCKPLPSIFYIEDMGKQVRVNVETIEHYHLTRAIMLMHISSRCFLSDITYFQLDVINSFYILHATS